MAPVRVARAFRLPIIAAMAALALSGCMHTSGPVAMAQPRERSRFPGLRPALRRASLRSPSDVADSGGAISALRNSFAAAPPRSYAPAPAAYAAAPMPAAYDAAYRLDAGDKLRVVVYGQEGLTNTYAIDAGGSITMPLIGSVPARGRTPAGLAVRNLRQAAQRLYPRSLGGGGDRILPAVLHPWRSRSPRPISLRAQHERRKRGGDCRRLLAARPARPRHADPHRRFRLMRDTWCRSAPRSAPAIPSWSANAGSDVPASFRGTRSDEPGISCQRSEIPVRRRMRRNDDHGLGRHFISNAWQRNPGCAAWRCRRWPCRSSPVHRS